MYFALNIFIAWILDVYQKIMLIFWLKLDQMQCVFAVCATLRLERASSLFDKTYREWANSWLYIDVKQSEGDKGNRVTNIDASRMVLHGVEPFHAVYAN